MLLIRNIYYSQYRIAVYCDRRQILMHLYSWLNQENEHEAKRQMGWINYASITRRTLQTMAQREFYL